jgi:hypothetical protein
MDITWPSLGLSVVKATFSPVMEALKPQLARRGSLQVAGQISGAAQDQINDAIELISESPTQLREFIASKAKKALSDVPDIFDDPNVRLWFQQESVRGLVSDATRRVLVVEDYSDARSTAGLSFQEYAQDDAWWGEWVFDVAVAFVALSLKGQLDEGDNVLLDAISAKIERESDTVKAQMLHLGSMPSDLLEASVLPLLQKEERFRFFQDPKRLNRLKELATRFAEGDLKASEQYLKISVYKATAAAFARSKKIDDATHWLSLASGEGANDLEVDYARLSNARGDYDQTLASLGSRRDSLSIMLTAEAIKEKSDLKSAIQYVEKSIKPDDLSGWGLSSLACWKAEDGEWNAAEQLLQAANPQQIDEAPSLIYTRARIRLAMLVSDPSERFELVQSDVGLPVPEKLRSDVEGQRLRQAAIADIEFFQDQIVDDFEDHRDWFEAQKLFLILSDSQHERHSWAMEQLASFCREPETAFLFGWLALSLRVPIDEAEFERELERRELIGELSGPELQAALQLNLARKKPIQVAAFLKKHESALDRSDLPNGFAASLRVEALAKGGDTSSARELLDEKRAVFEPETITRLDALISDAETGSVSVAGWLKAYQLSQSAIDLRNLVEALIDANHEDLGKYAIELWEMTHRAEDALVSANALFNLARDHELDELLHAVGSTTDGNAQILEHRAWADLRAGDLSEAKAKVEHLRASDPDNLGLRQLDINICIESGNWDDLASIAKQDLERAENREARHLLQSAGLAQIVDDPSVEELARAAVQKEPDKPDVLLGAYTAAIQMGKDWGTEAAGWLRRAIELSGEEGPIKSAPVTDLLELAKEQNRRSEDLGRQMLSGDFPLEILAKPMGLTLSELLLDRMANNRDERDARLKLSIPLIAGNRIQSDLQQYQTFAFDLSALLALETLGLLEKVLSSLPNVRIASGTLPYLLNDYMKAQRGQRSRFQQATELKELVSKGKIEVKDLPNLDDAAFAELEMARASGARYVHNYPIYEPGTLPHKVMPIPGFEDIVVSPTGLLMACENEGEIEPEEAKAALPLLGSDSRVWPSEAPLDLSSTFLIEHIALNSLQSARLLGALSTSANRLLISSETLQRIDDEIAQWEQLQKPLKAIEKVRDKLVAAIASGDAKHGGFRRRPSEDNEYDLGPSPLMALLSDASEYDVLVSAERAINKTGQLTDRNGLQRPIVTILDLLEHLDKLDAVEFGTSSNPRQRLRECGVSLVPVSTDEIIAAASTGTWQSGPTKPFRDIMEAIHLPLWRRVPALPDEAHWIEQGYLSVLQGIKEVWRDLDPERAAIVSTWLIDVLPNIRDLSGPENRDQVAAWSDRLRANIHLFLCQPVDVPPDKLDAYFNWYMDSVAPVLATRDKHLRLKVIEALVASLSDNDAIEIDEVNTISKKEVVAWSLRRVPVSLRKVVLDASEIQQILSDDAPTYRIGQDVARGDDVISFLKAVMRGQGGVLVAVDGKVIASEGEWDSAKGVVIDRDGQSVVFDFAGLFSDNVEDRLEAFVLVSEAAFLPFNTSAKWKAVLEKSALSVDQLRELNDDLSGTPSAWLEGFRSKDGPIGLFELQVSDPLYFQSFFRVDRQGPLSDLLREAVSGHREQSDLRHICFMIAPLCVSLDFDFADLVSSLDDMDALALAEDLKKAGDPFSLVAAFVILKERANHEQLRKLGTQLLCEAMDETGMLENAAEKFAAVAKSIIGYADLSGVLSECELPVRRCALLAHAGLISREMKRFEVDGSSLLEAADGWIGESFRFVGQTELAHGRWWTRQNLHPLIIKQQVRARLKSLIRSMEKSDQPEEWYRYVDPEKAGFPDINEFAAGPLDEFSPTWMDQTFPIEWLEKAMKGETVVEDQNALFNILMALEAPSDGDAARQLVLKLMERSNAEELPTSFELAAKAAVRWRDTELAEKAFFLAAEKSTEYDWELRSLAEIAFAFSFAESDSEKRLESLERMLSHIVNQRMSRQQAQRLVPALNKLYNLLPDWPVASQLRSAAILAC